jgi:hypothetical protein
MVDPVADLAMGRARPAADAARDRLLFTAPQGSALNVALSDCGREGAV